MSTKRTLNLILLNGASLPLLIWLGSKTGFSVFFVLATISGFVGIGLMLFAFNREKAHGDKSENVSARATVTILCVVGLWVAFVIYRNLAH